MKKYVSILILLLLILSFGGCAESEDYRLSLGTYVVEGEGMPLELELGKGKTFSLMNPLLSSHPSTGTYSIRNKQLMLNTESSTYYFDLNNEGFAFNEKKSEINDAEPAFETLANGTIFCKASPDRCRIDHNLGG